MEFTPEELMQAYEADIPTAEPEQAEPSQQEMMSQISPEEQQAAQQKVIQKAAQKQALAQQVLARKKQAMAQRQDQMFPTLRDSADAINYGAFNAQAGIFQGLAAGLNKLGMTGASNAINKGVNKTQQDHQESFKRAYARSPVAATAGAFIGSVAGATPVATAATAAGLQGLIGGAVAGAGMGASAYAKDAGERGLNMTVGGILGGPGASAMGAAGRGLKAALPRNITRKKALQDMATMAGNPNKMKEAYQAQSNLNKKFPGKDIKITPAQASDSELLRQVELKAPGTAEELASVQTGMMAEAKAIKEKLFKMIRTPLGKESALHLKQQAETIYNKVRPQPVKPKQLAQMESNKALDLTTKELLGKNKVLHDAEGNVIKKGTIGWFDELKRKIDDELEKLAQGKVSRFSDSDKIRINNAKKALTAGLDSSNGEYALARTLSAKTQFYEKTLNTIKSLGESPTIGQIHRALFGDKLKQQAFLEDFAQVSGNTKAARHVMTVLNRVNGLTAKKVARGGPKQETALLVGGLEKKIKTILGDNYGSTILEAMQQPRYGKMIEDMARTQSKEGFMVKFLRMTNMIAQETRAGTAAGVGMTSGSMSSRDGEQK